MKISVIGAGYVGLVTAAGLSQEHEVVCFDRDMDKIESLNNHKIPFYEKGLDELIAKGNISFTPYAQECLPDSDVIFICVGTPTIGYSCDLTQVEEAAMDIYWRTNDSKVVVVKSTVPPGTNDKILGILNQGDIIHSCVSNPEFLREGTAVKDFLEANRIVFGVRNKHSLETMFEVYRGIKAPKIPVAVRTAEMAKYVCNCALATKISFINEMSNICEKVGANINHIREVMATDPRIGHSFYEQGPGFGGSCFPKDVTALTEVARDNGYLPTLLDSVLNVNLFQRLMLFDKLYKTIDISGSKIAIWGAAFKPGTDDIRESPVIDLLHSLIEHGAYVRVHDPKATHNLKKIFTNEIDYYEKESPYLITKGMDALVVVTDWPEYMNADCSLIKCPVIVDGRGVIDRNAARCWGKTYVGFGV